MKNKIRIIVSTSAISVIAFSALAQNNPTPKTDQTEYHRQRTAQPRADRLNGAAKATELIGLEVKNYQNEKLGKVEDLALDMESGRIVQVILSTGGFLGVGDTHTAVPPGALHHDVAQKVLHLDATKEKLKSAPKFEMSKWGESSSTNHLSTVYRHYGQEPSLTFIEQGDNVRDDQRDSDQLRNNNGVPDLDRTTDKDRGPVQNADRTGDRDLGRQDLDRTTDKARVANQRQSQIPTSRLSHIQKASKLIGTPVKNLQDEKLGDVDNILVDLSSGRIVAVIVSAGGFIGIGDELSAVPPTAFRFTTDRAALQLDTSKEMLSKAPHFKANQWPDIGQPTYADGVYRAYGVEPYFTTNMTADADNTARNVRDRDDRTLTPMDQGNSKADIDTTAQIRKEIIAGKNLSVSARNVKIITNAGQVTLRGPVDTAEEKRLVGEIANRIARSENVNNQLEVKLTPTGRSQDGKK